MEDRKHFFEDVCIPRNEFIKEHVHLLKLLRHGNRAQLLAEANSQEAELRNETGMTGGVLETDPAKLIAQLKKMTSAELNNERGASLADRRLWRAIHEEFPIASLHKRERDKIMLVRELLKNPKSTPRTITLAVYGDTSPAIGNIVIPAKEKEHQFRYFVWEKRPTYSDYVASQVNKAQGKWGLSHFTTKEKSDLDQAFGNKSNYNKVYVTDWLDSFGAPNDRYGNPIYTSGWDVREKPTTGGRKKRKGGKKKKCSAYNNPF
jgi:hypothetical protein